VIRNVCIHVSNEQPLLADLFELPNANDAGLVCTNVRSMDGKRPVFIDHIGSTFFFPYHVVRFLEIPEAEMAAYAASGGRRAPGARRTNEASDGGEQDGADAGAAADGAGPDGEPQPGSYLPVAVGGPSDGAGEDGDLELEIDEGFLQRIRDI